MTKREALSMTLPLGQEAHLPRGSCGTTLFGVEAVTHKETGALDANITRIRLRNPASPRNATSNGRLSEPHRKWDKAVEGDDDFLDRGILRITTINPT